MRSRSQIAGRAAYESFIHDCYLQEVLGKGPSFQVIVVSFADTSEETHGTGPSQLKSEHGKHESFCLQYLIHGIAAINHEDDLLYGRAVDFLIFRSNEDGRCSNKLQLAKGHDLTREESVDIVDREEQRLGEKSEAVVDLDEPIHQN